MSAAVAAPLLSVEQYLRTPYRPDCDYIDGALQERALGEREHSVVQRFFTLLFGNNSKRWLVEVFPEYRVQVGPTRFRVPDLTVIRAGGAPQPILRTPPLLIIEILSPEDTLSRLQERVTDYLQSGVEHIWLIDPSTRRAYRADAFGFHEPPDGSADGTLTIAGSAIAVPLASLWQELDGQ